MTSPAAKRFYEAQHIAEHEGKKWAVYNPHGLPQEKLPIIYGFNNGGDPEWLHAVLVAEDGTFLGSHVCSSEVYMPADLGILEDTRPDRHEVFRAHYPDGYVMEFVPYSEVKGHEGLKVAVEKAVAKEKVRL